MQQVSRLHHVPLNPLLLAGGVGLFLLLLVMRTPGISDNSDDAKLVREGVSFVEASRVFKARYMYWPGDYPMAESRGFGQDGDGNGKIEGQERLSAWEHLYQAGLVSWDGADFSDRSRTVYGKNAPTVSGVENAGFTFTEFKNGAEMATALVLGQSTSAYHLAPALNIESDLYTKLRQEFQSFHFVETYQSCGVTTQESLPDGSSAGYAAIWLEAKRESCN